MTHAVFPLVIGILGITQTPAIKQVSDSVCAAKCERPMRRVARLGRDGSVETIPWLVTQDRHGHVFVINQHVMPEGPPLVFDTLGQLLGKLGRRPGQETERAISFLPSGVASSPTGDASHAKSAVAIMPFWIDAGSDDSIRVYGSGGMSVFGADLEPARTRAEPKIQKQPWSDMAHVVRLSNGVTLALGGEILESGQTQQYIHMQHASGEPWDVLPEPNIPGSVGTKRLIAPARNAARPRFWVAQFDFIDGLGYDLVQRDVSLGVFAALQYHPSSWRSQPRPSPNVRIGPPASRVVDLREVADGVVAVLIAQPREDWQRFGVDIHTLVGWWNRYETLVQVIDTKRGQLIATARCAGYPRRILDDHRVATYVEEGKDLSVDLWTVRLTP